MYVHVRTCSLSSLSSVVGTIYCMCGVYFEGHRGKAGAIQRAPKDVVVLIRFLLTLIRSVYSYLYIYYIYIYICIPPIFVGFIAPSVSPTVTTVTCGC